MIVVEYCRWLYYLARFAVLAPPIYMERVFLELELAFNLCQRAWCVFKIKRLRRGLIELGIHTASLEALADLGSQRDGAGSPLRRTN